MNKPYHYKNCGLDYVYLANGFKTHDSPYGGGVSIEDADDLHRVIARAVIGSPRAMRGPEVRFLRSLLDVSQEGLGDILGTSRATVARWEGGDDPIPGASDRALRMFYALKADGHELALRLVELVTQIDELKHEMAMFEETACGWQSKAA